jgi:hypothetical protein
MPLVKAPIDPGVVDTWAETHVAQATIRMR